MTIDSSRLMRFCDDPVIVEPPVSVPSTYIPAARQPRPPSAPLVRGAVAWLLDTGIAAPLSVFALMLFALGWLVVRDVTPRPFDAARVVEIDPPALTVAVPDLAVPLGGVPMAAHVDPARVASSSVRPAVVDTVSNRAPHAPGVFASQTVIYAPPAAAGAPAPVPAEPATAPVASGTGYRVISIVAKDLVLIASEKNGLVEAVPYHVGDSLPNGAKITAIDASDHRVVTSDGPIGSP